MSTTYRVKRIYEEPAKEDGYRILVDRLWPRGVSKQKAQIDLWAKDFTPSHELRKWFHEHPDQGAEFAIRYRTELEERHPIIESILVSLHDPTITLITASKDLEQGHSGILKRYLESWGQDNRRT